jgi:hypothetical protein
MTATAAPRRLAPPQRALLITAVVTAALARVMWLGRVPGINGDEAWYGVNVQAMLDGGAPFWHTGIGNPLNPLHSAPLLALTAIFPQPSFTVLRVTEAVFGILTVVLAYPLLRRPLGSRAALIATCLLAVSPLAVAYARFGWDPSGTPLVSLIAIAYGLRNRPVIAAAACMAAWFVHPTNVFLWPVAGAAWAPHAVARYLAAPAQWRRRVHIAAAIAIVLALPLVAWFLARVAANPNTSLPSVTMVIERLTSPSVWAAVVVGIARMWSGVSSAAHISAPFSPLAMLIADVLTCAFVIVAAIMCWRHVALHSHMRWLIAGITVAFGAFVIVAGPAAVVPTHERYALAFFLPLTVIGAVGCDALIAKWRTIGRGVVAVAVVLLALSTVAGYFTPLLVDGGRSGQPFRTGEVEPKAAAYAFIAADSRDAPAVAIVAQDWWLYWPLRYLARPERDRIRVEILPGANMPGGERPHGAPPPPPLIGEVKRYAVLFENSIEWNALRAQGRTPLFTAGDMRGRPILHVLALREGASELVAAPATLAARPAGR